MYQQIEFSDFVQAFHDRGRKTQFTYEGLRALYDYLNSYEIDTGEPLELDVISLCSEYAEYDSPLECAQNYGYEEGVDLEPHGSVDLLEVAELENKQALEWLQDKTHVIEIEGKQNIIIQQF